MRVVYGCTGEESNRRESPWKGDASPLGHRCRWSCGRVSNPLVPDSKDRGLEPLRPRQVGTGSENRTLLMAVCRTAASPVGLPGKVGSALRSRTGFPFGPGYEPEELADTRRARRVWTAGESNPASRACKAQLHPGAQPRLHGEGCGSRTRLSSLENWNLHRSANPRRVPSHGIEPRSPEYETGTSPTTLRGQMERVAGIEPAASTLAT